LTGQADLAKSQPSLKTQAAAGVKWTGASTAGRTVLQFAQIAVLAHLLSPSDFGLMGMMLVVLGFAEAFADMGISNAIIHRQNATREQLSSLYWLNMLSGIVVFAAVWAAAPLIVSLFHERRLAGLVFWVALIFVITPVGQQFQILLQKELRFRTLAAVEVTATGVGVAVSIVAAFLGQGVLSLIWGQLANAATRSTLLAGIGWRAWPPALRFQRSDLKGYLSFGLYQMGERSITYFNQRLDQILIGSLLGASALGYYTLAFNLAILPVARINPVITRVAFPVFAKVQDDCDRLRRGYMKVLSVLSMTNFPLLVGLAVLAPVFVPVVFGGQWLPSVVLLQILCFVGLVRTQMNPIGSLLLARGRADLGFHWNAALLASQVIGVWAGARMGGVVGVAISLLALHSLYLGLSYVFLIKPVLGPCARDFLGSSWPAFWMSVVMGAFVLCLERAIRSLAVASGPALSIGIVFGSMIYLFLARIFRCDDLQEIWGLAFGRPQAAEAEGI